MKNIMMLAGLLGALLLGWFGRDFFPQQESTLQASAKQEKKIKHWRAPMDPTYIRQEPGKSPMGMDLIPVYEDVVEKKEKKIKYWRAPMDPTYIRQESGKSPMGMDLIPVYEEEGTAEDLPGTVKISSRVIQTIGVKTAIAKRQDLFREIVTAGIVEADEQKINKINPKVTGWIGEMFIDSTGAVVKKDDMLLSIYSPELVSTQEEYLMALGFKKSSQNSSMEQARTSSRKLAKSSRQRLEYFDVPEHQIKALEKTGKVRKNLHIHSPYEGVITRLNVRKGAHVTPKTILYEITDLSTIWVNADVYEYEIPWVKKSDDVELTFTALPGKKYHGKVAYVYPYLEKKSRTIKVRIVVDNSNLELKPDMFANVRIHAAPRRNVVTVPNAAILYRGSKKIILKALGNGKFTPIEITTGITTDDLAEITSGIKVGDKIVTSSQFLIDSESRLSAALEMLSDEPQVTSPKNETESNKAAESNKMQDMDHSLMKNHEMQDKGKAKSHSMEMKMEEHTMPMKHSTD